MVLDARPGSHADNVSCHSGRVEISCDEESGVTDGAGDWEHAGDDGENPKHRGMEGFSSGEDNSVIIEAENGIIKSLERLPGTDEINEKNEPAEESNDLLKAPDGGYGWVICCAVFMNHMLYGGLQRSEGLFFLHFQSKFETSAQLAAWPGSLMSTLNLFMGPACGAVVSRYSVRTAFIVGTFFCFTGNLLTAFAPNIYFLFVSHTIFGGIGRGLMSGILLLNLYFDKHRSLATGLGMSGVGIGTLWVVPLIQYLFDEYDFSGAFLIISGLCLHGLLIAMMLRPLSMHCRFIKAKLLKKNRDVEGSESSMKLTSVTNNFHEKQEMENCDYKLHSVTEKLPLDQDKFCTASETETTRNPGQEHSVNDSNMNFFHKTVTEQHNKDVGEKSEPHENGLQPLIITSYKQNRASSKAQACDEDNCCKASLKICFPIEFKKSDNKKKKKAFYWDLLKHIPFMIFCTSTFLFVLAFRTAFTFLPAIVMSKGLSEQEAAIVLTISGALDTFGRIASGFILDLRPLQPLRPYVFNLLLFIIATSSLLVPSLMSLASLSIVCAVYGFMTGAFIAQKMVALVDILGREMMPSSLGIQKVFQGFGTLIGPPFAGALKDSLGTYDTSFYLGGACMIGSGLILSLSNILLRLQNRNSKS